MSATQDRRFVELRRTLVDMMAAGTAPSAEEVVEETNRRVLAERKHAKRQGLWSTVDDYETLMSHC